MTPQKLKLWLTMAGSAFLGAGLGYIQMHLAGGIPTTAQSAEAIVAGGAVAGLIAVVHLYQPPPEKRAPVDPVTKAANEVQP